MKSILKFSTLAMVAISVLFTACNPDDDIIIDPGTEGIQVGNGFYMASTAADPTASDVLVAETVEDDGFSSQDRTGFLANYIYVAAGSYNIVEITDKEITKSLGGTAETVTDMGSGCDHNDYTLVSLAEDGAAVSVGAGFYKVTYDQTTAELILIKIENAGVIGSATPGGWGADTKLEGSATADGGSWSATDVTLRGAGEYKVRFNCRWNLDRRIDPDAGFAADNAYQLFTNLGGSASDLLPGNDGPNIPFADGDDAIFTVTLNWTPADGFTLDLEKTDDAPVITFTPDDHQWAIIGDATAGGWDTDTDFNYEGFDSGTNTYTWKGASIDLIEGGFKFRTNDSWDENIGWGQVVLTGDTADFSDDGGNIKVAAGGVGNYIVVMTTNDDGTTYTADFAKQ